MLIEVKVPVLPESITEATLVNWHKKAGDAVKRDENLVDVETDKVVLELPAPGSGVVTEIRKPDGATVTAQEVIAVIDTDAKGAAPGDVAAAARATAPAAAPAPAVTAAAAAPGVAPAAARGRAARAVAVDRGDPDHLQRSEHGAGDRSAQPLQGSFRKGTRRQARIHGLFRQGGGACVEEIPGGQRIDRRHRHRVSRILRHRDRCRQPARSRGADHP